MSDRGIRVSAMWMQTFGENVSRLALWNLHTTPPITSARAVLWRRSRCAPVFPKDSKNEHWYAVLSHKGFELAAKARGRRRRSWNYFTNCSTSKANITASDTYRLYFEQPKENLKWIRSISNWVALTLLAGCCRDFLTKLELYKLNAII